LLSDGSLRFRNLSGLNGNSLIDRIPHPGIIAQFFGPHQMRFHFNPADVISRSVMSSRYPIVFAAVAGILMLGPLVEAEEFSLSDAKRIGAANSRFFSAPNETSEAISVSLDDQLKRHAQRIGEYESLIRPILQSHCAECHAEGNREGNFRFDTLNPDLVNGGDIDWWIELFSVVTKGEMPPSDAEPLSDEDRTKLVNWLSAELQVASSIKRRSQNHSGFRRLTKYEYNYALQDLLGVPWDFAKDLPPEAQSEDGFVNRSELLRLSVTQFEMYHRIAREALGRVIFTGDQPPSLHWLITADQLADREWEKQSTDLRKLAEELKDQPDELSKRQAKLKESFLQRPRGAHYENLETGRFASTQWQYYNAKYAFTPASSPTIPPEIQKSVAILPSGSGHRLIFELGNQLPDHGTMRVTAEVAAIGESNGAFPSLQLLFGWQASNEGRALLQVSQEDIPVTGTVDQPQIVQWDVPLGEIYPRNSVRKTSPMGVTPSPSEYIRIVNTSASSTTVQVRYVTVASPVYDSWPPESHQQIFQVADGLPEAFGDDEVARARSVIEAFMVRAWRGEVTPQDVDHKLLAFTSVRDRCDTFEEAIQEVLAIVLSSPRFLYVSQKPSAVLEGQTSVPERPVVEAIVGTKEEQVASLRSLNDEREESANRSLSDFALAERLSLFLWCSIPDQELIDLASSEKLSDREVLISQAQRMIQDPRSRRFVQQFVRQWLNLELLEFQNLKAKVPGFDPLLQEAMIGEPVEYIAELIRQDASVINLLDGDFAMLNERLARHYGVDGVKGNHFRRVPMADHQKRGGLITQAGFLAMNSDWPDSHPLKRSVWLLERVLNDPPPPPPPAVPQIDIADPRIAQMTLKERIEDHRNQPACASCHIKIDPWGIAFENYDALGRWRDSIDGKPVDSDSELFNGEMLSGIDGLKRFLLLNRQDQLVQSVVEKMIAYSIGRSLSFSDQNEIEKVVKQVRLKDDGFRECLIAIIASDLFLQW